MKKDPCSRRKINHSTVSSLLSEEIMDDNTTITRTELFERFAKISASMEEYFEEVTMTKGQVTNIIKMFFKK